MTKYGCVIYKNPQFLRVTHKVIVENLGFEVEKLHLWLPKPPENLRQREFKIEMVEPPPTKLSQERKYHNEIYYWRLAEEKLKKGYFQFGLQFTCTVYEIRSRITSDQITKYWPNPKLIKGADTKIRNLALKIVTDIPNHYLQARSIYNWIIDNCEYRHPPLKRGILATLKTRSGDCGDFAMLFSSLCQSVGINARPVFGHYTRSGDHPHAWAEFFLPACGWIPVDLSRGQKDNRDYYFGNLDNERIAFSKGTNYHLVPPLPNGKKVLFLQSRAIWIDSGNYDRIKTQTTLDVGKTHEKRRR